MLRQDELDFIKAISTLELLPALLKELRLAMSCRKKNQAVPVGSRSTCGRAARRPPSQLASKRKANELVSSGDSMEPANRRPASGSESAPLPVNSSVTSEQAAVGSRQPGSSGGRATYTRYCPCPSPRLGKVGRSNPQPWFRTRPNPVSQPRQPIGACLATCPGL